MFEGTLRAGRRFDAARPEVAIVLTPHHVHVEGHMAVVVSGAMRGMLDGGASGVELKVQVDRGIARQVHDAIASAGIPVVAISYGGNDQATAVMPMGTDNAPTAKVSGAAHIVER